MNMDNIGNMRSDKNSRPSAHTLIVGSRVDGICITLKVLENLLKSAGVKLKTLHVTGDAATVSDSLFEMIGKHCPKIEYFTLSLAQPAILEKLQDLTSKCKKMSHFTLKDWEQNFKDEHLVLLLSSEWKLKSLKLIGAAITKSSLTCLPETLTLLDIRSCRSITVQALNQIRERCHALTTLRTSFFYDQSKLDDVGYHWPSLESCLVSTKVLLNFSEFRTLSDLFLSSKARNVSINELVNDLPNLKKLQLELISAKDEVVNFGLHLKVLIIKSDESLSDNVLLSLPYCKTLEDLHVKGTTLKTVLEDLLTKCVKLKYIHSFCTVLEKHELFRLLFGEKPETDTILDISITE